MSQVRVLSVAGLYFWAEPQRTLKVNHYFAQDALRNTHCGQLGGYLENFL